MAGSSSRGRLWGPCPLGCSDRKKGSLLVGRHAWTCVACGESRGVLATVALAAGVGDRDYGAIAVYAEERGLVGDGDEWVPAAASDVEVRGRLPVLLPVRQSAWRAVAAGVPPGLAVAGALAYDEERRAARAPTLDAARRLWWLADHVCPELGLVYRRISVSWWRSVSTVEEAITVKREVGCG